LMKLRRPPRFVLSLLLPTLWIAGCGKPAPKQTHVTPSLPPATEEAIVQSLVNGVIPTPEEVKSGKIPPARKTCEEFRAGLPEDWFQELIEVPEDPAQPQGRKIRVFYYGMIHRGTVPTVFFNGGPNDDSHNYFALFKSLPAFQDSISLIYIDQRGTGCSDPYPKGKETETLQRLRFYGSQGIVADAEAIRAKVWAGKKWNVFGHSYGAFVVHRYWVQAPDAIRASFAYAGALSPDPYERTKNRLLAQLRINEAYLDRYPDDRATLAQLVDYLTPNRCFQTKDTKSQACGSELLDEFNGLLAFNDQWLSLHKWVNTMVTRQGVSTDGVALFASTHRFLKIGSPLTSSAIARRVIDWTDRNVPDFDTAICTRISGELRTQGKDLAQAPINECTVLFQNPLQTPSELKEHIKALPQDVITLERLKKSLVAHADARFYLYSGKNDPWAPVESFEAELKAVADLKNVHYSSFSTSGHDGYYTEPMFWADLARESKE
jgi:pimeloyl-ACP methyl ester carboxylesterase